MCSRICMYIPLYTPYASCLVHYFHLGHYLMVNMPWSICMYLCLYIHMHTTWQPSNMMNHQKDKLFHLGAKILNIYILSLLDLSWSWTPQPRSSAVACQTTWTWGNREEYLQGVESVGYLVNTCKVVTLSLRQTLRGTYSCKARSSWRLHRSWTKAGHFQLASSCTWTIFEIAPEI